MNRHNRESREMVRTSAGSSWLFGHSRSENSQDQLKTRLRDQARNVSVFYSREFGMMARKHVAGWTAGDPGEPRSNCGGPSSFNPSVLINFPGTSAQDELKEALAKAEAQ